MRILHFTDRLSAGGVTTVIQDLVKLQQAEHQVKIGVISPGEWQGRSSSPPVSGTRLLVELFQADVVHCHHRRASLVARLLRRKGVVDHVHNFFTGSPVLTYRGDVVVSVAEQIAVHTRREYPHIAGRQRTIVNGTFDSGFLYEREVSDCANSLRLVGAGRLDEQKDPLQFVRFVHRVKNSGLAVKATWFGDGALREEFEELVVALGIEDECVLRGWLERTEMLDEMKKADAILMTSKWEGLPMVGVEALSVGTPVLTTEIGHFSKILSASCPSWVLGSDLIVDDFAQGMLTKLRTESRVQRQVARQIWQDNFDLLNLRNSWNEVYYDARG